MTWVKLDATFWGDPRRSAAGDEATILYLRAMNWCASQLTDGHVPRHVLAEIAPKTRGKRAERWAETLVNAGLFEVTSGGWFAPDYPKWGPMADNAAYQAERNRERQARHRERRQSNRVTNPVSNPVSNGVTNALVTGQEKKRRDNPPVVPPSGDAAKGRKSQIPEDFQPDENQRRWAAEERPRVDVWAEVAKFVDYHRSKGNTFVDHQRAFRTWLRNAKPTGPAINGHASSIDRYAQFEIPSEPIG